MFTIKKGKNEYFGHVMRNNKYQLIIQGKIEVTRGTGHREISWLQSLRRWFNVSRETLFRRAADKV